MKRSVLVVENHHDLRSAIVAALEREDFECDAVRSGDAALIQLRKHQYQYIFVDDDEATAAQALLNDLTSQPNSPKLVVLTEFDRLDDVPFLRKPFDFKQLLARVSG
jgi:DNA-binding response OmpR family regulator